jgi:ubiquinone biosynthesis protein COQ4
LTPDARRPVSFIDDADLAYIMRRYREIHDLTHVTLGMPINMLGKFVFFLYLFN